MEGALTSVDCYQESGNTTAVSVLACSQGGASLASFSSSLSFTNIAVICVQFAYECVLGISLLYSNEVTRISSSE